MAKEVIMPKFGFTQEEAEVVAIYKQNGDSVRNGDPLMEVTTDKVNMEVEATSAGILSGLTLKVGDVVPVATVIAYILTAEEAAAGVAPPPPHSTNGVAEVGLEGGTPSYPPSFSDGAPANQREATPVAARLMAEAGIIPATVTGTGPQGRITRQDVEAFLASAKVTETVNGKVKASPNARRLAREQGIPLAELVGTGPDGRIQGWDVAEWVARPRAPEVVEARLERDTSSSPPTSSAGEVTGKHEDLPSFSPFTEIPFTSMRRAIARNLTKSYQEAPHIFFQKEVDMTALQALLETLRQRPSPAKLSMTVLLAKVVAWALAQHPKLNSHLEGETIRQYHKVNMGIAVALEEGLIVPVLRDVGGKGLGQLSVELGDLTKRARATQLKAADLADGTFTISNLGMFGIDQFTAIINPPQVAILAIGATTKRFVPDAQGQPMLRPIGTLTLSVDHRVIDGAVAAHFMATLAEGMAEPSLLLM
jgi:pyruvate dehydrogenase E2 component (dihydrolipoamide acetyltransferase)